MPYMPELAYKITCDMDGTLLSLLQTWACPVERSRERSFVQRIENLARRRLLIVTPSEIP